ncbi:hypothetical protein [Daejeonia sp. YH14]|uniref:hypothetical protein n=1 Tax=Daejeonia sp. YH14 TaxID=3439042 RepID=UPI003F4929F9
MKKYLGKQEYEVLKELGSNPLRFPGSDVLFYRFSRGLIFTDEIVFFIEDGRVADIAITEYILGIAVKNIFYQPTEKMEFVEANLLSKKKHIFS